MTHTALEIIKKNIDYARACATGKQNVKIVVVVSGSAGDKLNWQGRFDTTKALLFGPDTAVLSLEERIGEKRRAGNFLGTLLAHKQIKAYAHNNAIPYRDCVALTGMIIGRGERISPFTQVEGNRKPAIKVNSGWGGASASSTLARATSRGNLNLTAIEEALLYFVPVAKYLERGGFRGILDKWGDETEIASIDLQSEPAVDSEWCDCDVIKCISVLTITAELARQKDWVVFDEDENMLAQLSRNSQEGLIAELKALHVKPGPDGTYAAGISLGPVAVSYDVLDIAEEVFAHEITAAGVFFDFDPWFLMALTLPADDRLWQARVAADPGLKALEQMVPDFFRKVQSLKERFAEKYGRPLKIRTLNLGSDVYWADIGQHKAMAAKYLSLLAQTPGGEIARYLENITLQPDANHNIILGSTIGKDITVSHSVIINSRLTGQGRITESVVKDSVLHDPVMEKAFAVLCHRPRGRLHLAMGSGLYNSLGAADLALEKGMRSATLLTAEGPRELMVAEDTDLRDKPTNYDQPVCGNALSFGEAYNLMQDVSMTELAARREKALKALDASEL